MIQFTDYAPYVSIVQYHLSVAWQPATFRAFRIIRNFQANCLFAGVSITQDNSKLYETVDIRFNEK